MSPIHSLFPGGAAAAPADMPNAEVEDLLHRLRGPEGVELLVQMNQQLDDMQAHLRQRLGQGADSSVYEQLQAGLSAVSAARDILQRVPVGSSDSFIGNRPGEKAGRNLRSER